MIKAKHLRNDPIEKSDGTRIYIGRFWPRNVKKGEKFEFWYRELSPSENLLARYSSGKITWKEYARRFRQEITESENGLERITTLARDSASGKTFTLLCDHPKRLPQDKCHRFLVKELIDEEAAKMTGARTLLKRSDGDRHSLRRR